MATIGHQRDPFRARLPPAEPSVRFGCPITLCTLPRRPPCHPPNRTFQICSNNNYDHLTFRALPAMITCLAGFRRAGRDLGCESDPREILFQASRLGKGTNIGQEGQDSLGEVWRGQGLMHDSVRDTIRRFVDRYVHRDKVIIDSVVSTRPMIDLVVTTSPSGHWAADPSLPPSLEQRRSGPMDVWHAFEGFLRVIPENAHRIDSPARCASTLTKLVLAEGSNHDKG